MIGFLKHLNVRISRNIHFESAIPHFFTCIFTLNDSFFFIFQSTMPVTEVKIRRKKELHFLKKLKINLLVNPDNKGNMPLETVDIPPKVLVPAFGT